MKRYRHEARMRMHRALNDYNHPHDMAVMLQELKKITNDYASRFGVTFIQGETLLELWDYSSLAHLSTLKPLGVPLICIFDDKGRISRIELSIKQFNAWIDPRINYGLSVPLPDKKQTTVYTPGGSNVFNI